MMKERIMMQIWVQIVLVSGMCLVKPTIAANILMIHPWDSKSHDNFHSAIAKSLLSVGHHVTAITFYPGSVKHSNYSAINIDEHQESSEVTNIMPVSDALQMSNSVIALYKYFLEIIAKRDCHRIFQLNEIQDLLKSKVKLFDIVILDVVYIMAECFLPIADQLDIPVIGTVVPRSWVNAEWIMGNPFNPAVLPLETASYSQPMNFLQRLENTWNCLIVLMLYRYYTLPELEKFYQEVFPRLNFADRKKISMLFLNNNPVLLPQPMLPTVINVGGLHVQPAKPLPKNLQTFIHGAKHGVVLFSIGSFIQSNNMPTEMLSIFRQTFAQIPQRVIWKTEGEIENLSDNVMVSKWLPQRDILAHQNVVAFMTHCGISGTYEGLHNGVPMVLLPIFADQISNAALLHQLGIGPHLDIKNLTKEKLLNALNDVINGTRYREKVKEISILMKDRPMSPQESVVYWIEYVIRHNGASHLQSAALEMPLYQYLLLDVFGIILFIVLVIFIVSYYIMNIMYHYIRRKFCDVKMKIN